MKLERTENFDKALQELKQGLDTAIFNDKKHLRFDLGDIGNEIGFAVAKHFSEEIGFSKEDFLRGIKHGISLVDDTHSKIKKQ
jgi:hypothetical protein